MQLRSKIRNASAELVYQGFLAFRARTLGALLAGVVWREEKRRVLGKCRDCETNSGKSCDSSPGLLQVPRHGW